MDSTEKTHISICVCTFKRPELLRRTLGAIAKVRTSENLSFSVVVADNDVAESAREVCERFQAQSLIPLIYCTEPQQNIALARNRSLKHASGDFIAFIDDDEFPDPDWLSQLIQTCERFSAHGALGPVRPHFDTPPPSWLVKGRFCDRPEYPTGTRLTWRQTRTGNVLFKRSIIEGIASPFRQEFGSGGEDQDFFRRMMEKGCQFVWCNEAPVFEVVPPDRWQRKYLLRRAFQRGQNERYLLTWTSVLKSLIAVPVYAIALPIVFLAGQHRFMSLLVKLTDHLGKLLASVGLRFIGEKYLSQSNCVVPASA